MENTESRYCDVKNMEDTESDALSAEIWKTERFSIIIKYYVMWCNLCKFVMHCYVSDVKPIYVTDNRGYKADFFRPVTVYYLAYMCFQICTFYNFCREVGQLSGQQHANIMSLCFSLFHDTR